MMKTIQLKTAVAMKLGHVTCMDQSEAIKITTGHVTTTGK